MVKHIRLAVLGIVLLFLPACGLTGGPGLAAVDTEATVTAHVQATLTAVDYNAAAAQVTEAVSPPTATPLPPADAPDTASPSLTPASSDPTPVSLMPVIAYFACDPCVVEPGGSATLSWDLDGATAAYLDGRGVAAPGDTIVYPDQTTTYRLTAVNNNGQSEKTVTVEVRGLPTIHYFTCLPCEVTKGEQSTLSWDLSGATAAYLDGQGVPAPGSAVVAPAQTTTYRLLAASERGSVERLVTVTVQEGGNPEAVSEALGQLGYDVRSVGYLPLATGEDTMGVVMQAVAMAPESQEVADQYFAGFKTLYENYPGQMLTVGLYDGVRYMAFVTVESPTFEAFLRGEMDGGPFWQVATWNVWDEWTARWLAGDALNFAQQDFVSKSFLY